MPPTSTPSHYVENGLRGPTPARTAGVATHCAPMVRRFNQHPLKKLKFSKLAQNQRMRKQIKWVVEWDNYTEYKPNCSGSCLLQPLISAACRHFSDTRIWLISVTFTGVVASTGSVVNGTPGVPLCWFLTGWDAPCRAAVRNQGLAWLACWLQDPTS